MLRSVKALLFVTTWITIVIGCGAEKSKDQQASEFYDEKLHVEDEKACNEKGFMYDTLETKCKDSGDDQLKLATFPCTESGVVGESTKEDEATVTKFREFLDEGYEPRQCGVGADGTIVVIVVLKGKTDDEATLTIQRLVFLGQALSPEKKSGNGSGEAYVSLAFGDATSSGGGLCAEQRVEYRKSDGETAPEMTNAPEEIRFKLAYTATGVTVFEDADCVTALATGAELTIPKGNKYVSFYYKREATYDATFEVNPDDQAIKVPDPLAIGGEPPTSTP